MAKRRNSQDRCPHCQRFVRDGALACRDCFQLKGKLTRLLNRIQTREFLRPIAKFEAP